MSDDVLAAALAALKQERDEVEARYQRVREDFDGYQRRAQRERERVQEGVLRDVLRDLVVVVDGFDRALESRTSDVKVLLDGVASLRCQIVGIVERLREGSQHA